MKLAKGFLYIEDVNTGEKYEEYKVVYTAQSADKARECIRWFEKSEYNRLLVVQESEYKSLDAFRRLFVNVLAQHKRYGLQSVYIVQKHNRLYLERV